MKWIQILGVVMIASVIGFEAKAEEITKYGFENKNEIAKKCLEVWGYNRHDTIERRLSFPFFQQAAACTSHYKNGEWKKRIEKEREFVKNHPWYKGKNWQWETKSEYTCRIQHHLGGIELCTKPYYLN